MVEPEPHDATAARPRRLPVVPVTAAGIREGDPVVLGILVEQRGGAVVAYLAGLTPTGGALRAAAAAFVDLRVALLAAAAEAPAPAEVDRGPSGGTGRAPLAGDGSLAPPGPSDGSDAAARDRASDPLNLPLLTAVRRAAARHAENPLRPDGRRRPEERTAVCERIPRLLVAGAAGRLPREDELRLLAHVRACPDCHAVNAAFTRAESRFRAGASVALTPAEVGGLVAAMALATA